MIVGVAIKHRETGEVFSLPKPARHHTAIHALVDVGKFAHAKGEQGFVTETGQFMNRKQALLHVVACEQEGQLHGSELLSEDLW
jgi:hypothetical protein